VIEQVAYGLVWLAASILAGVAAHRAFTNAGATPFEGAVAGFGAAIFVPTLFCQWVWLLPVGAGAGMVIGCVVAGLFAVLLIRRTGSSTSGGDWGASIASVLPLLTLLTVAGVSLWAVHIKGIDEWDALMYHGPAAVSLIQKGSLWGWHTASPYTAYPDLVGLQGAQIFLVTRSTALMDAVQILPGIFVALAAWAWAADGRAKPMPGAIAVLGVIMPGFYVELRTLYVDVGYAAALFGAMWCIALWMRASTRAKERDADTSRRSWVLVGSVGLLTGASAAIKPSALPVLGVLTVIAVVLVARRKLGLAPAAIALGAAFFACAPMYLRNLADFHNFAYPVAFGLGPIKLRGAAGVPTGDSFFAHPSPLAFFKALVRGAVSPAPHYEYDVIQGGFGRIVALFTLLGLGGLVAAWRRHALASLRWCITPAVMAIAIELLAPKAFTPRYSITGFMLLVVIVAGLYRAMSPRFATIATAVLFAISLAMVANNEHRMRQGIPAQDTLRARGSDWHGQLTGGLRLIGTSWGFLSGQPCGTAVLLVEDAPQVGIYSTFNMPAYGDGLCNDVKILPRDGKHHVSEDSLNRALDHLTKSFVIVPEASRDEVERAAAARGLPVQQVGEADWPQMGLLQVKFHPKIADTEAQVVLKVGR
jgi:hypothetical protein